MNHEYTGAPVEARALSFETPANIRYLQRALDSLDATELAKRPAVSSYVRPTIPGEWWPWALVNCPLTFISRTPSGHVARMPLANTGERMVRVSPDDDTEEEIAAEIGYRESRKGEEIDLDEPAPVSRWWEVSYNDATGAAREALQAAQRMWRRAETVLRVNAEFHERLAEGVR